jgi:hypothetical protein
MTMLTFRNTFMFITTILLGALFMGAPAQAAEGCDTANCSGSTGEFEGVIGEPLEDVADYVDITPKVTMSWPKGVETTRVACDGGQPRRDRRPTSPRSVPSCSQGTTSSHRLPKRPTRSLVSIASSRCGRAR